MDGTCGSTTYESGAYLRKKYCPSVFALIKIHSPVREHRSLQGLFFMLQYLIKFNVYK